MTIAFVGFSYGPRYGQFLPLYAETVLRRYPDAGLLLYVDRVLDKATASQLAEIVDRHRADVRLRENYSFGLSANAFASLPSQGKQAMRWLFNDEAFAEFDNIYLGDIDMLMLDEPVNLEEAHLEHCEVLGLPYSNYLRVQHVGGRSSMRAVLGSLRRGDLKTARHGLRALDPHVVRRLSGLHFVRVADYYSRVQPHFDAFRRQLYDTRSEPVNNEQVLYDLTVAAGFASLPVCTTTPDLDPTHSELPAFRPHHGIHLGIFRSNNPIASHPQVLASDVYASYYKSYRELLNEKEFRDVLSESGSLVKHQIEGLDRFLQGWVNQA